MGTTREGGCSFLVVFSSLGMEAKVACWVVGWSSASDSAVFSCSDSLEVSHPYCVSLPLPLPFLFLSSSFVFFLFVFPFLFSCCSLPLVLFLFSSSSSSSFCRVFHLWYASYPSHASYSTVAPRISILHCSILFYSRNLLSALVVLPCLRILLVCVVMFCCSVLLCCVVVY